MNKEITMFLYRAQFNGERIISIQEIAHNEGRSIEDYLSDMGGIVEKRYCNTILTVDTMNGGALVFGLIREKSAFTLFFQAEGMVEAARIANWLQTRT